MNSPLVLVLLCGLCLTALALADPISPNMQWNIQKLTEHFNVTADKGLFGSPIFLQGIDCHGKFEMLVLRESLFVYIEILSDMVKSTQDMEIKMSIMAIRARMEDLMISCFRTREQALKNRLQELCDLKTSNATVQRKAVRELRPMLQWAFKLCGNSNKAS